MTITLQLAGSIIGCAPAGERSTIAKRVLPNQHRPSVELHSPEESGPRCVSNCRSSGVARLDEEKWTAIPHILLYRASSTARYHTNPSLRRKYSISCGSSFNGFAGTPP